jgi:hypothetical protein
MHLELRISDDLAHLLTTEYPDLPRAVVEALALEGYRSKRFSEGRVREMSGFSSRMQVHAFLKAHAALLGSHPGSSGGMGRVTGHQQSRFGACLGCPSFGLAGKASLKTRARPLSKFLGSRSPWPRNLERIV